MSDAAARVALRPVEPNDLPIFFVQQQNKAARHMAAFAAPEPNDRGRFDIHWEKNLIDASVTVFTVTEGNAVAGHIMVHHAFGQPEVGYWLGKSYWGRGIASRALQLLLQRWTKRPLFARVVQDNHASIRVLLKAGFLVTGSDTAFAHGRQATVTEWLLTLPGE